MSDKRTWHPWTHVAGIVLLASVMFLILGSPTGNDSRPRPTERLREHRERYRGQIEQLAFYIDTLHEVSEARQIEIMAAVLAILRDDFQVQARQEERFLYPAVDRLAGASVPPFTAFLRHDHQVIDRWIDDLDRISTEPLADHNRFCRRLERLLGLLEAHLAAEDELLLPLLDRSMTPEQFRRDIGSKIGIN
jgi:iron-sulfur cluster repair protein YtfE (RIC family)